MIDNNRIKFLVNILNKYKLDGYIAGPGYDLNYLTSISCFPDERFKALVVLSNGDTFFICPELYYEDFKNSLGDINIYIWSDNEGVNQLFEKIRKIYNLENKDFAVDSSIRAIDLIDMKNIIGCNFKNISEISKELRIIKDHKEIENLTIAAKIADLTYLEIIKYIKPGLTEKDISDKIKELLFHFGGEDLSFEPIVASGPNSSMPHYNGNQREIESKDIIVLDYGCVYNGYCSDTSRTIFLGEPSPKQKEIYNIVLEANLAAEKLAVAGKRACELDNIARGVIKKYGYGEYFINRTGHGIGIEIHEEPYINSSNNELLENGMAFSIEPGIYIPGEFGMRIEDIVVINDDNPLILNKSPKNIIII